MRDMIYRDEAIDAICKVCPISGDYRKCNGYPETSTWCDELVALRSLPPAEPERQNRRIFQEIIVEYPSISTYPEYEGKPYFSIKYTENGQEFIGYGTYKPEVLSEYLKEYFMPSAEPEWDEMLVICDNCGHAIHVKRVDMQKDATNAEQT